MRWILFAAMVEFALAGFVLGVVLAPDVQWLLRAYGIIVAAMGAGCGVGFLRMFDAMRCAENARDRHSWAARRRWLWGLVGREVIRRDRNYWTRSM